MRRTISVERILNKIDREREDWERYISQESAENSISRDLAKIKEREENIRRYRNVLNGLEKARDMVIAIARN
ncbi:MAG: hypothetical protein KKB59_18870 [Spirochaetes bacterium]|nr:hypothetical protein [Spirochaetota bacterium]